MSTPNAGALTRMRLPVSIGGACWVVILCKGMSNGTTASDRMERMVIPHMKMWPQGVANCLVVWLTSTAASHCGVYYGVCLAAGP